MPNYLYAYGGPWIIAQEATSRLKRLPPGQDIINSFLLKCVNYEFNCGDNWLNVEKNQYFLCLQQIYKINLVPCLIILGS